MLQDLQKLPLDFDVESKTVLKKCVEAREALAELKGFARTIPNEAILLNMLVLQEAKESSAIENIITTHDELVQAEVSQEPVSRETKEVLNYAKALRLGFDLIKQNRFISSNFIIQIQNELEDLKAGFRKSGVSLINDKTKEVVYTPPESYDTIVDLMSNLEKFINYDELADLDPLVKMAIIHYQFESIHPFYDGNGRTGRILNVLYLVLKDLLDVPILYLSRYIILHKDDYYQLLQDLRNKPDETWEIWILYMLEAIQKTAQETIILIGAIRQLMNQYKHEIRTKLPKIYSKDLLENLFKHPYTKIGYLRQDIDKHYMTARTYLEQLCEHGFLEKHTFGKHNYYLNRPLFELFTNLPL